MAIMKNISSILCIMVSLITLICSCGLNSETNETPLTNPISGGCDTCKVIKTLDNQRGFISYDSVNDLFAIRIPVEGTIDELEVGIITNMADDLKEEVMNFDYSNGTVEVVFSGEFKEFNNDSFIGPVGTTYYYLQLSYLKITNTTKE